MLGFKLNHVSNWPQVVSQNGTVAKKRDYLLRLRRKLLRSSTRMRLPILNSVRAWARLFHVSASRGLDLSQQSPNRRKVGLWNSLVGGGRRYVTLAKWVTEVGHWPPSSLGNFSVIKETYFCGANCVALLQCELLLRQLHVHKIHTAQITWIVVLVHIPTFVIWT